MNAKKFSDAMSELDVKYVDEALNYKKKAKSSRWVKYGAVAACLCLAMLTGLLFKYPSNDVVSVPGFLVVTAYAASSNEELVMQEGVELPVDYFWSPSMSSRPGFGLKLFDPQNHDATFEVSVDGGSLLLWNENGMEYLEPPTDIENNGTTVYWTSLGKTVEEDFVGDKAFVTITTKENGNILGYAVIEIYSEVTDGETWYYSKLIKSVSFPKNDDGSHQKVNDEYVASQVEQVKTDAKARDTMR